MARTDQSCPRSFHSGTQAATQCLQFCTPCHAVPAKLLSCFASTWVNKYRVDQPCVVLLQDSASVAGLYALLQQQSLIQSNPTLAILLAANNLAQGNWNSGGALPMSRPMTMASDPGQAAALASSIAATCHPYTHVEDAVMACHAMTASDLVPPFTSCDTVPNYLNAGSVMAPMAEWPYQPAVATPQPEVPGPFSLHTEYGLADSLESFPGCGPQRHNHVREMRSARHSPY